MNLRILFKTKNQTIIRKCEKHKNLSSIRDNNSKTVPQAGNFSNLGKIEIYLKDGR